LHTNFLLFLIVPQLSSPPYYALRASDFAKGYDGQVEGQVGFVRLWLCDNLVLELLYNFAAAAAKFVFYRSDQCFWYFLPNYAATAA